MGTNKHNHCMDCGKYVYPDCGAYEYVEREGIRCIPCLKEQRNGAQAKLDEIREWGCGLSFSKIPHCPGHDQLTSAHLGAILVEIVDHPERMIVTSLCGYRGEEEDG